MAVAAYYTETVEVSGRKVAAINAGGFLGSVMGVGIPYLFNAENLKIVFGSLIAGGVAGAVYSIYATRNMDSGRGRAVERHGRLGCAEARQLCRLEFPHARHVRKQYPALIGA